MEIAGEAKGAENKITQRSPRRGDLLLCGLCVISVFPGGLRFLRDLFPPPNNPVPQANSPIRSGDSELA